MRSACSLARLCQKVARRSSSGPFKVAQFATALTNTVTNHAVSAIEVLRSHDRSQRRSNGWSLFAGCLAIAATSAVISLADDDSDDVIETTEGLEAYLAARGVTLAEFLELEAEEEAAQNALASAPGADALAAVLSAPGRDPDAAVTFFDAIEAGNAALVDYLVAHGADPNSHEPTEPTPLEAAVAAGRVDVALRLLHHGADARAASGVTPLPLCMAACLLPDASSRNAQLLLALLEAGADPNAPGPGGIRALHAAIQRLCPAHAAALISFGANVNATTSAGDSPLNLAVRLADDTTVHHLLSTSGVDIDHPSSDDFSPLCAALVNGSEQMASSLVCAGADLHRINRHGASPVLAAIATDSGHALKAMLDTGRLSPESLAGSDPKPLLQLAVEFRSPQAAYALLVAGADANRPWQRTAADAAVATTPAPSVAVVSTRAPRLTSLMLLPPEVLSKLPPPPKRDASDDLVTAYSKEVADAVQANTAAEAAVASSAAVQTYHATAAANAEASEI